MDHILVVADETEAEALRALLASPDWQVTTATTTARAREALRAADMNLVVLSTPLTDDPDNAFGRHLRADPRGQEVPLLLLMPLEGIADYVTVVASGADSFLRRPYQSSDLLDTVHGLLSGRADEFICAGETITLRPCKRQGHSLLAAAFRALLRSNPASSAARGGAGSAGPRAGGDDYRRLLREANDPILFLDADGKVLEVNHRAAEVLGRPAEDLVGRSYLELVPAAELEQERTRFAELLRQGSLRMDNLHLRRADGRVMAMDVSASVVEVGDTEIVCAIARDAAPRALLQDQLQQAQKMEAIGRLAGGVAHDFNNLLTIINGYGELLLGSLPESDPARRLVLEITMAGERAAALTRQLLAFSRKQILEPKLLDLNNLVRDLSRLLTRLIGEDIVLRAELQSPLGHVRADPGQLEQVLMNLAVNSRDAMPEGGELTISTANVALDEAFANLHAGVRPGWYVRLAVQDTGCGMDKATRAHIFEPFFTTKGPGKGTGLGLATVFGIVEQSGGHIEVETEPEHGTTFWIYFPAADAAAMPTNGVPKALGSLHGSETILLVEDEHGVRALTQHVLRMHGYTVLTASNGREAVEVCAARHERIDLLVTDVVMPHMGGRQLAERLLTLHPEMRVLYLSGYPDDALLQHGVAAGIALLQKPFAPSALALKVREVLGTLPQPAGLH